MEKNKEKAQSRYNLNESDFELLGELQKDAFYNRNIKKNYYEAIQRWVSVKVMIDSRFEKEEREELDKIEIEFYKTPKIKVSDNLKCYAEFGNISPRKKYILTQLSKYKLKVLDNYSQKLRELMRLYRIALTDVESKAKLD